MEHSNWGSMHQNNVDIVVHRLGNTSRMSVHNTWTRTGRTYLANVISYQSLGTYVAVPQDVGYVGPLGLGIGGRYASNDSYAPTLLAAYPPGADVHETDGKTYWHKTPESPEIGTLERPVRRSGSILPYSSAPGTDTWLFPRTATHYQDVHSVTYAFRVDVTAGDVMYGGLPNIPISEASLHHSRSSVHSMYDAVLAYVCFDPIILDASTVLDILWTVRFA